MSFPRFWRFLSSLLLCLTMASALAQDVTLRWAMHPGSHNTPVIEHFVPLYEELTGVRVEVELLPPDQVRERMQIEAIGGTGYYDIGYHSPGWFGGFADHVVDLTPFIEAHGFDVSQYPDLIIESHMTSPLRPGEIIALPHTPFAPMLIYRRDFFEHADEQAAFEAEYGRALTPPETWQELYEVASFFTRDAGESVAGQTLEQSLYGWADAMRHPSGSARAFIVLLYSTGLRGFDDAFEPDIDHPVLLEAADFFLDLTRNTAPPGVVNWDFLEHLELFRTGQLAMATMWPAGIDTVEDPSGAAAGNVGYQPLPRWEGNLADFPQGVPFLGGGGLMVFDTPNAEESFKFLQWLLEENEIEWARRTQAFSRANHFTDPELLAERDYYASFLPAFQQVLEHVFVRQGIPEFGSVMWDGTADFWTDVFSGDLSPEQAQQRWVNDMRRQFERAGYY